jgi:undecaprenyl-diphosphatase
MDDMVFLNGAGGMQSTLAIAITILSYITFAIITSIVLRNSPGSVDIELARAIQSIQIRGINLFMQAVSLPGQSAIAYGLLALMPVALVLLKYPREAILIFVAGMMALGGTCAIKLLTKRPRPTAGFVRVLETREDFGFPSGHVTFYVSTFGFLLHFIIQHIEPSFWKTIVMITIGLLVLFVGPSRIYLGTHWPTDVLGGYSLGVVILATVIKG